MSDDWITKALKEASEQWEAMPPEIKAAVEASKRDWEAQMGRERNLHKQQEREGLR